ncbi:MAG: NinB/YbcN family protein [Acidobacteriaceae bacterium]
MKREFILQTDYDRRAFAHRLCEIAETKPLRVSVCVYRKNRSLAQNRLNFMWCDHIRKWMWETGRGYCVEGDTEPSRPFTSEEIHEWHKELFLPTESYQINGRTITRRSSHNKDVSTFAQFLSEIDMYWTTRGLVLPHPDEMYREAMG